MTESEVPTDAVAAPYWEAAARGELQIPNCRSCDAPFWYPRAACPRCLSTAIDWVAASGSGTIYASSVHHRGPTGEFQAEAPYVVALVDLDEGVRLLTNIVRVDPADVAIGQRVQSRWVERDDAPLLVFEPVAT